VLHGRPGIRLQLCPAQQEQGLRLGGVREVAVQQPAQPDDLGLDRALPGRFPHGLHHDVNRSGPVDGMGLQHVHGDYVRWHPAEP
jgi:hypothetical protein